MLLKMSGLFGSPAAGADVDESLTQFSMASMTSWPVILLLDLSMLLSELMRAGKAVGYTVEWDDPKCEYKIINLFHGVRTYLLIN